MSIRFRCSSGHKLVAPDERVGRKARCPKCQESVTIPAVSVVASDPPTDEPAASSPPKENPKTSAQPPPLRPRAERKAVPPPIRPQRERGPVGAPPEMPPDNAKNDSEDRQEESAKPQAVGWISTRPGYRPQRERVRIVYWFAAGLSLLTGICLWPALANIGSFGDRLWVSTVIFLSTLQIAYIVWMVSVPDWSALRVMMCVFTCVAAIYAVGMAVVFFSEPLSPTLFHFSARHSRLATLWCGLIVILSGLMVYLLGRYDTAWRKAYFLTHKPASSAPRCGGLA